MKENISDKVKKVEKYLAEEFGIKTYEQLEKAVKKVPDIDIGLFVSPIVKQSDK